MPKIERGYAEKKINAREKNWIENERKLIFFTDERITWTAKNAAFYTGQNVSKSTGTKTVTEFYSQNYEKKHAGKHRNGLGYTGRRWAGCCIADTEKSQAHYITLIYEKHVRLMLKNIKKYIATT